MGEALLGGLVCGVLVGEMAADLGPPTYTRGKWPTLRRHRHIPTILVSFWFEWHFTPNHNSFIVNALCRRTTLILLATSVSLDCPSMQLPPSPLPSMPLMYARFYGLNMCIWEKSEIIHKQFLLISNFLNFKIKKLSYKDKFVLLQISDLKTLNFINV